MNYKLIVLLSLCIGFVVNVSASELTIPRSFEFLAVDGKDVGGFFNKPRIIALAPGEHKIALKYDVAIEDAGNQRVEEFIRSDPILVTLNVQAGKNYRLVPHSSIKFSPRDYAKDPRIKVVTSEGDDANAEIALMVKKDNSAWAKMTQTYDQPAATPKSDMAQLTGSTGVNAVPVLTISGKIAPAAAASAHPTPASSMLIYWWNQADQETRNAFLIQITK
ncbi:MAG: hypothetical protein A6F71_07235 [Cycloclasticus sp. symbiont of Poecilosclerida sp. M]|nr:MAG: hypothetical protein A6F71_07235 [Cycloclasticus sp. symbiont of Poecilosclerida sp. M]